jgi:hypothetical protein
MRLKTNLIISVIFLGLLGFVYLYEIKGGQERQLEAERQKQLLDFEDHEAQRLTIDAGDTLLVLERRDGDWVLTSPVETGADADAVERYLRALRETEIEGEPLQDSTAVAADPGVLADYGLDNPRLAVHLGLLADAAPADTFYFGDDTPTDRFTYLRRSGRAPEVLRVRAWRYDNLAKGLHDLRDRRLLAFDKEQVRRLRLRHDGSEVDIVRQEGTWRLTAPWNRAADGTAIDGLLDRLHSERTERIVDEVPDAQRLADAGLAPGQESVEVTLWLGEDRAEKRLRLGSVADDGERHALDTSRPHLFLVDTTTVNRLRASADELRAKRVADIDAGSVRSVRLADAGRVVFHAEKDSSGVWQIVEPTGREAKTWRFTTLLSDLDRLEATRFVADAADVAALDKVAFGLDEPAWSLQVGTLDGDGLRLDVGARAEDGTHYVATDVVPTVAAVDGDALEALHLGLDDVSTTPEASTSAAEDPDEGADTAADGG